METVDFTAGTVVSTIFRLFSSGTQKVGFRLLLRSQSIYFDCCSSLARKFSSTLCVVGVTDEFGTSDMGHSLTGNGKLHARGKRCQFVFPTFVPNVKGDRF